MSYPVKTVKKLIEVALPLDAINAAAAKEKSIRHGHPSTLHLWWARRPLAAARAVIFSQMVNDPSGRWELENPGKMPPNHLKASWAAKRKQLFKIIEDLVVWENTTNEEVLERARNEIRKSWQEVCELNKEHPKANEIFNTEVLPALHDPFAGGGAIPLEASRLGLESYASDLNPVAVLINKAMIEVPPRFRGRKPVGPVIQGETRLSYETEWPGSTGLAEDIRRYGAYIRSEAEKRIGYLYPKITITHEMIIERPDLSNYIGQSLRIIAYLWARTVKSPNPAYHEIDVPLVSSFVLSLKENKEAYIQPITNQHGYRFSVRAEKPKDLDKTEKGTKFSRADFVCLMSGSPISGEYIKQEGKAKRMGARLMALVVEAGRDRIYLSPTQEQENIAKSAKPTWKPTGDIPIRMTGGNCTPYGLNTWGELFTDRQLVSLVEYSNLISEIRERIKADAVSAGYFDDGVGIEKGGCGASAYADSICTYLGIALSRLTDISNSLCRWEVTKTQVRNLFGRQAIPMMWDYAENNTFAEAAGDYIVSLNSMVKAIERLPNDQIGFAVQADAQTQEISYGKAISTDPPYYDNIAYADLSDFFYSWLRHTLSPVFPNLFSTLAVPKAEELVATVGRHGSKEMAESFFLQGMTLAMRNLANKSNPAIPVTIYYAFKQSETESSEGTASTGWETFLEALMRAGFALTGTWPMRTELSNRMIGSGANALASSIVLVCRRRPENAPTASRREFIRELNIVLPDALEEMIHGTDSGKSPVAPVDLSQAVIGPGMGVFSKYSAVLEADGSRMSVRTALQLINKYFLENDFDPETQWCLKWFEQNGWKEGLFGQADDLSRALGTSVEGVAESGVIESGGGKVRLLRPTEYPSDWDPKKDKNIPIWETLHHLIRILRTDGETQTGRLLGSVKSQIEGVRLLAFRLYTLCERAGWAEDARTYNELMTSWAAVESAAGQVKVADRQGELF